MSRMIEHLEQRSLMSAAPDPAAVQEHLDALRAARAELAEQHEAFADKLAADRQAIADVIAGARAEFKQLGQSIGDARAEGDADFVADLREQLAAARADFHDDLGKAKAKLKADLLSRRDAIKEVAQSIREAASSINEGASDLRDAPNGVSGDDRAQICSLVESLKAMATDGGVTQEQVQDFVEKVQLALGNPDHPDVPSTEVPAHPAPPVVELPSHPPLEEVPPTSGDLPPTITHPLVRPAHG